MWAEKPRSVPVPLRQRKQGDMGTSGDAWGVRGPPDHLRQVKLSSPL